MKNTRHAFIWTEAIFPTFHPMQAQPNGNSHAEPIRDFEWIFCVLLVDYVNRFASCASDFTQSVLLEFLLNSSNVRVNFGAYDMTLGTCALS